jgi:uncharacterized protein (TIGR00251 family)
VPANGDSAIVAVPDGVLIRLHVQPRASRTELAGRHGSALKIRLAAPPVDGAANEALLDFLAERLGVPRRAMTLEHGHTGRAKTVRADGVTLAVARRTLGLD